VLAGVFAASSFTGGILSSDHRRHSLRYQRRGHNRVDCDVRKGIGRHPGVHRLVRILNDRGPTGCLDGRQASCAVIARSRENYADDSIMPERRGGAKQHVDGRPMAVFPWTHAEHDDVVFDHEVVVGGRDQDRAVAQRHAVLGWPARQTTGPAENFGKRAWAAWRDVKDDADGRGQVLREPSNHCLERLDSTRGGADYDELAAVR
jgi:hypothetical protein